MTTKIIRVALFSISISSSALSQVYEGKQKHIDQILQTVSEFSTYLVAGKSDPLIDLYTADAKIFPNNNDILSGADLEAYWAPSENSTVIYHKVTPSEITIVKKTAYDYGYYEGTTRLDDGTELSWKGKYVIVWKLVDKEWKIYLDCWNRIE